MTKLLLVEDNATLSYIIKSSLEDIIGGYEVVVAENGIEGIKAWKEFKPDVIVSDIDMPVMNGYDMVKRIRETDGDTPILFTSALTSPKDVRKGFDIGVNNYVKKPVIPDELDAHICALLKLKEGKKSRNEEDLCNFGQYTLNPKHCTLINNTTEKQQLLTQKETEILMMFAENKGELVRKDAIISQLWGKDKDFYTSRSLDVFLTKLRKLFANDPQVKIVTKKGIGYILVINENYS